jgi:RNA polymerase sigma-70 factor (ECF subfamily)
MAGSLEWTGDRTDGAVVRAVLDGETELFGVLIEKYRAEFGRYAAAVMGDADAAADAMQEAFIRAYEALADCRDPDRFRAWFFRIVANQCRTALARRRPHAELESVPLAAPDRADTALERGELAAMLGRALASLTDEQREAFVLKHVDGRSYEEMSALLGVGVDALKMRVHRARDALRSLLGPER